MNISNRINQKEALHRCKKFRKKILDISQQVQALHIGSAFSCTEIVDAIYFELMSDPKKLGRETFLMSKGHGCMIQYVILEELKIISQKDLDQYCTKDGILGCHPDFENPGIAASTGSLGHGLSIATGIAYSNKHTGNNENVYSVLSDGELQEGSTWEATIMASSLELNNLICFVDNNNYQSLGKMSDTHPSMYPIVEKFKSFGWYSTEVNGHDIQAICEAVFNRELDKPCMINCKTTKGKGVSYMENIPIWHYRSPNKEEYNKALEELEN